MLKELEEVTGFGYRAERLSELMGFYRDLVSIDRKLAEGVYEKVRLHHLIACISKTFLAMQSTEEKTKKGKKAAQKASKGAKQAAQKSSKSAKKAAKKAAKLAKLVSKRAKQAAKKAAKLARIAAQSSNQ